MSIGKHLGTSAGHIQIQIYPEHSRLGLFVFG